MKDGLYTRHEVACIIADLLGNCACDYSGNDEWLPQYCDFADKVCPDTVGVACWEQYLTHIDKKAGGAGMNECLKCDCYDEDVGCTMPSVDKWYACPLCVFEDELKEIFERVEGGNQNDS